MVYVGLLTCPPLRRWFRWASGANAKAFVSRLTSLAMTPRGDPVYWVEELFWANTATFATTSDDANRRTRMRHPNRYRRENVTTGWKRTSGLTLMRNLGLTARLAPIAYCEARFQRRMRSRLWLTDPAVLRGLRQAHGPVPVRPHDRSPKSVFTPSCFRVFLQGVGRKY